MPWHGADPSRRGHAGVGAVAGQAEHRWPGPPEIAVAMVPDENRPLAAEAFVISTSPYWRIIDSPLADLRDRRLPQYTTAS